MVVMDYAHYFLGNMVNGHNCWNIKILNTVYSSRNEKRYH